MLISNEVFPKTEGSAPALGLLLLFLKGFYKNVPAWALQKGRGAPPTPFTFQLSPRLAQISGPGAGAWLCVWTRTRQALLRILSGLFLIFSPPCSLFLWSHTKFYRVPLAPSPQFLRSEMLSIYGAGLRLPSETVLCRRVCITNAMPG